MSTEHALLLLQHSLSSFSGNTNYPTKLPHRFIIQFKSKSSKLSFQTLHIFSGKFFYRQKNSNSFSLPGLFQTPTSFHNLLKFDCDGVWINERFLVNLMEKNDVCSSESVDGSRDVWSSKSSDSSSADHLVVMVNGILGSSTDWKFASEQFVKELPDKVFVHCSERNVSKLTLDGVDVMGERLAEEVIEVIRRKPNMRKVSFIAHSVGGLVARYAIGRLYRPPQNEPIQDSSNKESKVDSIGTICGLEAMNFITVATPHLGSRGNKQVPFLFGVTAFEKLASVVIHWIFRRTGRHLFLTDEDEGKPPLLKRMVEDYDGCYFMSALRTFKRRVIYSNVGYDHIVGWRTSSIRRDSELPKWEDSLKEKYPHVVYEEHCKACDADQCDLTEDNGSDKIEEELVTGLSCLSWEKVDVSFHSSRIRFAAHSVIQVKDRISHIEGADVIHHMIDHFLT